VGHVKDELCISSSTFNNCLLSVDVQIADVIFFPFTKHEAARTLIEANTLNLIHYHDLLYGISHRPLTRMNFFMFLANL